MLSNVVQIGIQAINKITDLWAAGTSDSLIDYTSPSRVEPIALIDSDALYHEALPQVMQSLLSQFAGYYLQAIAISATVGKINVSRHLDKLNPSRNPISSAVNSIGYLMATESYTDRLPLVGETKRNLSLEAFDRERLLLEEDKHELNVDKFNYQRARDTIANNQWQTTNTAHAEKAKQDALNALNSYELNVKKMGNDEADRKLKNDLARAGFDLSKANSAIQNDLAQANYKLRVAEREDKLKTSEFMVGRDTLSVIRELSDLSVGKLFTVEITDGLHKASIPVSIRLMASQLPTNNLVNILAMNNQDTSVKERYYAWKEGRIEFIKDLVLCQDLIDEHKKNLMNDKTGIYSEILSRRRKNQVSGLVTANPSVATASNIVIMTDDTVDQLQMKINGKLSDFKTREKVFKETYVMIMAVIDKKWNRITFYHRGIATHTELGMSDLKASSRGNGPDVTEILKAFTAGHSPSL